MKKFYFTDWLKSLVDVPYKRNLNLEWDQALNEALDNNIEINICDPDRDNDICTCIIGNYEVWIFGYNWYILPDNFGTIYIPLSKPNLREESMIRSITQYKLQRRIKAEIKKYRKLNQPKTYRNTLNHYRENLVGKDRAKFLDFDG